jgi:peroxiredoxin family protein
MAEEERERASRPRKMARIATKGTLDGAYPPLIVATTAAALGWEVGIFFSFSGLNIVHKSKQKHLQVAALGNPAMPMPVPNLIGAIPGMTAMGTTVMKTMFKNHGVAAVDAGVKLIPRAMTMEVFGPRDPAFMAGCEPACGAAAFIDFAADADLGMFI